MFCFGVFGDLCVLFLSLLLTCLKWLFMCYFWWFGFGCVGLPAQFYLGCFTCYFVLKFWFYDDFDLLMLIDLLWVAFWGFSYFLCWFWLLWVRVCLILILCCDVIVCLCVIWGLNFWCLVDLFWSVLIGWCLCCWVYAEFLCLVYGWVWGWRFALVLGCLCVLLFLFVVWSCLLGFGVNWFGVCIYIAWIKLI